MARMLVSTAVERIKSATHDISDEYSNERCMEFLNNAIQQASSLLIAAKYPSLINEIVIHDGDTLPTNFMATCGTYPLRMTGDTVRIIDSDYEYVRFRYFATPNNVTELTDYLPFNHDGINEAIVRAAIILAQNENEYDVTQDLSLVNALQQAIAGALTTTEETTQ